MHLVAGETLEIVIRSQLNLDAADIGILFELNKQRVVDLLIYRGIGSIVLARVAERADG